MSDPEKINLLKRKIKVCHIITKMVYGGASLGTLRLAKDVAQDKFRSTIICGLQSKDEGNLIAGFNDHSCSVIIVPEIVRELDPLKELIAFMKLITIFRRNKFDIVHTHGSRVSVIARLAAAFCRIPVVIYTIHGWTLKAGLSLISIFRLIEKILAKLTTKFLFQTQSDLDEAIQHSIGTQDQYVLIGNGIDLEPFLNVNINRKQNIKQDFKIGSKMVVGTVGRLSMQKNPKEFIAIAKKILETRDDVLFISVGGGELLNDMIRYVKQLHLENDIIFTGVRQDIPELVENFYVFILPSLWEGMPRSVIEAMALGKPVVAHAIGGIDEIIKDGINGLIVPINKTDIFVDKIQLLLNDISLYKKISKANKPNALKYDFKTVVDKTQMLYSKLIMSTSS